MRQPLADRTSLKLNHTIALCINLDFNHGISGQQINHKNKDKPYIQVPRNGGVLLRSASFATGNYKYYFIAYDHFQTDNYFPNDCHLT